MFDLLLPRIASDKRARDCSELGLPARVFFPPARAATLRKNGRRAIINAVTSPARLAAVQRASCEKTSEANPPDLRLLRLEVLRLGDGSSMSIPGTESDVI